MSKKVVLRIALFALIGMLIAGAIVRTIDKTGGVAEARGNRDGGRRAQDNAASRQAGLGNDSGLSNGSGLDTGTGIGLAQVDEWLTFEGTVSSAGEDALVVETTAGEQITIENRPWWFAQEQGFTAAVGDMVTLTGFYEDGTVEVGQISDTTTGQGVELRDETGRPMWAGRGRRGGQE